MVGTTVSHYNILEHLSGGAMGVVYKALDMQLDRVVALKFLPPDLSRDPEAKQRFIHEAKAASALDHQNICVVHEIGETDEGQVFIVMAYCEGETLKKKIERGPLRIQEAADLAIQIAHGLQRAHEHGIVHRDVKPANVMVTDEGVVKIVDFGLAKLSGRTLLTKTGSMLGTAAYMSPEQARGEQADHRTDIWSLGVVLYEMLAGRRPFVAEYENALVYSILNTDPEPITGLRTGVPLELERIITKCLAKAPGERYQHVDELVVDLQTIQHASGLPPSSPSRPTTRRGLSTRLALTGAAVIVVALGAWFLLGRESGGLSELRKRSIAVLPFSPFGRTFDDSVFADGIHDDILTQLSKISGLRVIARTSMVLYRDSKKTPSQIANDLDVGYLLEGSTRRSGGKIRITTQLINTADEGHVWAETYDRNDADLFAVQSDIAQRIASSMETVLSPAEKASVEEIPTTSTEAYNYYLRGKYYWDNYIDSTGNAKAAELFEEAARIDPSFAQAFAMASVAHGAVLNWDQTAARLTRVRTALEMARTINPEDPVVHWAQGMYYAYRDTVYPAPVHRLSMALQEFQKAVKIRPNWAEPYRDIGATLFWLGHLQEARDSFRRFSSLSPMTLTYIVGLWTPSIWLKEWTVARKDVDEYLARRPDDPVGYTAKAAILIDGFGDLDGARAVLDSGMALPPNQHRPRSYDVTLRSYWRVDYFSGQYEDALACLGNTDWWGKGQTYWALNQQANAKGCFDSALAQAQRGPAGYWKQRGIALALAWRGEHQNAARELEKTRGLATTWQEEKGIEEVSAQLAVLAGDYDRALALLRVLIAQPGFLSTWNLRLDPLYKPLRSNPHFQALLKEYE